MRFGREQLTRKQGAAGCFHFHNALSIVGVLPGVSVGAPTFLAGGGGPLLFYGSSGNAL